MLATGFLALIIVAAVSIADPLDSPPPGYAHNTAEGDLRALRNAIWDAEDALERLLPIANTESQETSHHRIHQARIRVVNLQEYEWIRNNQDSLDPVRALSADLVGGVSRSALRRRLRRLRQRDPDRGLSDHLRRAQ